MKRINILITLVFFPLFLLSGFGQTPPESKKWLKEVLKHRKKIHKEYKTENAPLTEEDRKSFKGLDYFEPNPEYAVQAKFIQTPDAEPFDMSTVSTKTKQYVKYGELHFQLGEEKLTLAVYQSLKLREMKEYKNYLFVPFKDYTNGNETYGGGRYIDMNLPLGETVLLDFNKAYNPYCAYSSGWSCPIPPDENHLKIEIRAGVKDWKAAHEH